MVRSASTTVCPVDESTWSTRYVMSPTTGDSAEATVRVRVQVPLHASASVIAPVRNDDEMCTVVTPDVTVRVGLNDWEAAAPDAARPIVL